MLLNNTLFVVGAGASREFGLPDGSALANDIATALDIRFDHGGRMYGAGDPMILQELRQQARDINPLLFKCWAIRDGIPLSYSIDNFLDKHAHDAEMQLCGRMGIVRCILREERKSSLYFDSGEPATTIDFRAASKTWLVSLFKMLQADCRASHVNGFFDNCRILTFNYDRCIEHFFFEALRRNYGLDDLGAAKVMGALGLMHVYGRVGALRWERGKAENERVVDFGQTHAPLAELTGAIRTYADDRGDQDKLALMHRWVSEAHTVVFLGFSYQDQNLDLLTPAGVAARQMLGSAFGISEFNRGIIADELRRRFQHIDGAHPNVRLAELTCAQTLEEYSRALV